MKTHTVIDGNAFYEIDEECYEKLKQRERRDVNPPENSPEDGREGKIGRNPDFCKNRQKMPE